MAGLFQQFDRSGQDRPRTLIAQGKVEEAESCNDWFPLCAIVLVSVAVPGPVADQNGLGVAASKSSV
jgi:hypothetical protein